MLFIDNLGMSTTENELTMLFSQVGEVVSVKINRDRVSGASKGFGFITMSALSEADKAVSRFNFHSINGRKLKVRLAIPRAQRGTKRPIFEP
jgi:RNA recognition motif-containing protein